MLAHLSSRPLWVSASGSPSGISSAAIMRSQCFSQFQLSFSPQPQWVPAPPAKSHPPLQAAALLRLFAKKGVRRGTDEIACILNLLALIAFL